MLQQLVSSSGVLAGFELPVDLDRKSELGQFMTPAAVAHFMACLFPPSTLPVCRLLDAGAGMGALSSAFLDRWASGNFSFQQVNAHAWEIDDRLRSQLRRTLETHAAKLNLQLQIQAGDFIDQAVQACLQGQGGYTHAILNPPYKKMGSDSAHRHTLRQLGIESVNLYAAFVALAIELLAPGGVLVAILPRSFCNGPYYRPFRQQILARCAIRQLHLFDSRRQAFKQDDVLQENIIIVLERQAQQGAVLVSTSTDERLHDLRTQTHAFERIVQPGDAQQFFHIPTSSQLGALERSVHLEHTLATLGIQVSTGPVVDFRLREHLRPSPEPGTVPLLYPGHFSGGSMQWPKPGLNKAQAIACNESTRKWLYPRGFYSVVRRFSSKEERRRIMASVVSPEACGESEWLGLENHLNVFHEQKHGLPEALAHGLTAFLNTSAVDEHFRRFNGHTQVNATDLKQMKYPSRSALSALGLWAMQQPTPLTQAMLDAQFNQLFGAELA